MCKKVITSEFVSYGHPDKIADTIADSLLDAYLEQDKNTRAGIEVMVKDNNVVLGGEVSSNAIINYDTIVRDIFKGLDFPPNHNLNPENIKIINLIGKQSSEIHQGVDKSENVIGAGDQGFVVGFASDDTDVYMPLGHYMAKKICQWVASQRKLGLGPDTKSQVIVIRDDATYENKVDYILVSTMHIKDIDVKEVEAIVKKAIFNNMVGFSDDIFNQYIRGNEDSIEIVVNPCGSWNIGGPVSDCGVTGRKLVVDQYGGYSNIGGGAYCVDGDTEYIGEDLKWHKIKDYDGGKVGQWNNGILEFVMPSKYHINDSEKMYHFHSPNSIDMVLSENHSMVAKTSKGNIYKIKVKDVIDKIKTNVTGFKDPIPCTFEYYPNSKGINMTDDEIRLQVAFCADGTFSSIPGDKGRINIKKKKKIERLEWLLKRTNTDYHLLNKGEFNNHYYWFIPPVPNNKSLYSLFKDASYRQLAIVAKEVLKWDGDEKNGIFRTTHKEDADFIQFVFSLVYGKHSYINKDSRVGGVKKLNDREYAINSICYSVTIGTTNEISFGGIKSKVQIDDFDCDKMYCFTVPSGMLLLRRSDKIFVTGNCGKDYTKVDRSAAYMARYLAKNIVASGIAKTAKVELSYVIGVPEPSSINIELTGTKVDIDIDRLKEWIKKNIDLTPYGIMKRFDYSYGRNGYTEINGFYGVDASTPALKVYYPWEKLDIANDIKNLFNLSVLSTVL